LSVEGVDEAVSLDKLAGDWRLYQLRRGHRFSVDDVLTAWAGVQSRPDALRLLDLGAGIGSVGLLALWRMQPEATLCMLEVQEVSHRLARASVGINGLAGRVELHHGDLRDPTALPSGESYDLITCSPPYIPLGKGVVSPHPQRAGARMELCGSVFDYCTTAARVLAPSGRIAIVFAAKDPRGEQAVEAAGLSLLWRQEVVFREGKEATIAVLVAGHSAELSVEAERRPPLIVRQADGLFTKPYWEVRREMGAKLPHRGEVNAPRGSTR
jgi:tRNA1(Val) A37 N6-methylase TrmN6